MHKRRFQRPKSDFFDSKGADNITQPSKNETNFFTLTLAKETLSEEDRTIEVSITSETLVKRWWGSMVLGHNPGECRLERIKTVGSFLFAHGRDPQYGVVPLGTILDVWLDEETRKYRAKLKFDTDEKSEIIFQKVKSGALKGISVGVEFYKWLEVDAGSEERGFAGPISIAVDWEIVEISLEPTPAIANVGVGLKNESATGNPASTEIKKEEEKNMKFKVTRNGVEVEVFESELTSEERIQLGLDTPAVKTEGQNENLKATEQARCLGIRKICSQFEIGAADEEKFLKEDFSIEMVQKFALDKLATERKPLATPNGQTVDETDKFRAAAVDGFALRAGVKVEKPAPGANDFRGFSLSQLMQFCYQRQNGKAFWGSPEELFDLITKPGEKQRFAGESEKFSGAYASSSDFPLILANVANKSMLQAYQEAPTTYQEWCAIGSLKDFKPATGVRLSEASGLRPLNEHGEFEHAEMTESATRRQLGTYGIKWSLTRKMIINDDMDAFSEMPAAYALAARRNINRDVYVTLNGNPVMDEDSVAMFNAAHGNLDAAPALVSVASLALAYTAMMLQQDLKNEAYLNIMPKFILLPPGRSTAAVQVLTAQSDPGQLIPGVPNPYYGKLIPIVEPMLQFGAGGSATAWRLIADSRQAKTIQVDFLNGRDVPIMESQVEFDMLGITYRMYHDWGVKGMDFRGAYLNPGL